MEFRLPPKGSLAKDHANFEDCLAAAAAGGTGPGRHLCRLADDLRRRIEPRSSTKDATTSAVRIEIGQGVVITSSLNNEAVADLGLKNGDDVWAAIKASDVMIGRSDRDGRAR